MLTFQQVLLFSFGKVNTIQNFVISPYFHYAIFNLFFAVILASYYDYKLSPLHAHCCCDGSLYYICLIYCKEFGFINCGVL